MATIMRTVDTVTGEVLAERVLTPVEVRSRRGKLTRRTQAKWAAAGVSKPRRPRSPYQARALASEQGVLAPEGVVLTRNLCMGHRDSGQNSSYTDKFGFAPFMPDGRRHGTALVPMTA